jgi:hypothetical protein
MSILSKILAIVVGAFIGLVGFYYATAVPLCLVFLPDNNLCGLPSALFAAPIGALVGAVAGWIIARRMMSPRTGNGADA